MSAEVRHGAKAIVTFPIPYFGRSTNVFDHILFSGSILLHETTITFSSFIIVSCLSTDVTADSGGGGFKRYFEEVALLLKKRFPDVLIQREIVEVRNRQSNMGKGLRRKSTVGSFHVTT